MQGERPQCGCGSGLRPARCCALDFNALPMFGSDGPLRATVARALELHEAGAVADAEQMCREVLELAPVQPDALGLLYRICRADARMAAAEALLRRFVRIHPNVFWANNDLVLMLINKGAVLEAEIHARNAVRIAPENPQSHNLMGMVMTEVNRPQTGEFHYRRAMELSGQRDPILLANLAWNLKNQGKMSEARALYEESTSANPAILQSLLGWARTEEADRNFDRAGELLDRAEKISPDDPSILLTRAVVHGRKAKYGEALDTLNRAVPQDGRGLGANELLEKGRLLDRLGRYDEAWEAFTEAKRLCREVSGLVYRAEQARQLSDRLKSFFTETRLGILPRAGVRNDVPQPIFILGFPRSGTTLVEQTLSAHPRITAGDELPFVHELADSMQRSLDSPLSYPEALSELWMGDRRHGLDELRDSYLERVRRMGFVEPGAAWFTDKMPLNEMHLGLIGLMFPGAPLIHVVRHPLDVVCSVFSNNLTHGFYCAFDLETVARHYALTMDLVEHYRSQMTLRYLALHYEDVVDDQEATVRRMLDFIGEPFDERCLSFHENRRYARTASYAQVTERLYDTSRYRHRHYRRQLEPVIPILEPVIRRLEYGLDDG